MPPVKPKIPKFSGGPTVKRPGWDVTNLEILDGRSIHAVESKEQVQRMYNLLREVIGIPDDYTIQSVPGSCTGAMESAMWNLLGPLSVDVPISAKFSQMWYDDIKNELGKNVRGIKSDHGTLPDLSKVNFDNDVVFTWNETGSGVQVPNGDWIPDDRSGLTICDGATAVLGVDLPWEKLDATAFSLQKCLGSEGGLGILVLSPRALKRLNSWKPTWAIPYIFRLNLGLRSTPSMMTIADILDSLEWINRNGGKQFMISRAYESSSILYNWAEKTPWIEPLSKNPEIRSMTSVVLKVIDPNITAPEIVNFMATNNAGLDIFGYIGGPDEEIRFWTGGMVDPDDIKLVLPWLDYAYQQI
jgi:phosphoserine aminotransferase